MLLHVALLEGKVVGSCVSWEDCGNSTQLASIMHRWKQASASDMLQGAASNMPQDTASDLESDMPQDAASDLESDGGASQQQQQQQRTIDFKRSWASEKLPKGYRLATIHEVELHRSELFRSGALQTWDISKLLDGWIDGPGYDNRPVREFRPELGTCILNCKLPDGSFTFSFPLVVLCMMHNPPLMG